MPGEGRERKCPLWVISEHTDGESQTSALPQRADMPSVGTLSANSGHRALSSADAGYYEGTG